MLKQQSSLALLLFKLAVQLLMFMHLTEGKDGQVQSFKVIFAIIITLVTVIGTYWVMQGGHSHHL